MNLDSTFTELIEIDLNKRSSEFARVISLLLDAERDWRTSSVTVKEFIEKIEQFVGDSITKKSTIRSLDKLQPDNLNAAWEVESLDSLLEILKSYPNKNIRSVFNEL